MLHSATPDALGIVQIFLRLLCAMAVGTIIGTEREYSNRPAGMRTHILVALGSCAVMITSQLLFQQYSSFGALPDPARLPAQVITGVGFLGAGTILREGANVTGLTTAASLWAVACLGISAGAGYYAVAAIGTVFIFVTLTIFEILQNRIVGPEIGLRLGWIETADIAAGLDALNHHAASQTAGIRDITTRRLENGNYQIGFQVQIGGIHAKRRKDHFLKGLAADPAIRQIHFKYAEDSQHGPENPA